MGRRLTDEDEGLHALGPAGNWNESRYLDFWDAASGVGGWFRMGQRPNEGHAEMSACLYLPDGTTAFDYQRVPITANSLTAGPLSWEVGEPWRANRVSYAGEMIVLQDPWVLTDPKTAFTTSPRRRVSLRLDSATTGVGTTLGQDQDQVSLVFLPGQAEGHYQHLAEVSGTVAVGADAWDVHGRGGKDHSWGPRNWHAKRWLRWLTASVDDGNGFMLTRSVSGDGSLQRRGGYLLRDGEFLVVEGFRMHNTYAAAPHHELVRSTVGITVAGQDLTATAEPAHWLPLRHRQPGPDGAPATLRIVKSPVTWTWGDGRTAAGHLEFHDLLASDGVPVGLHE
jgi:hypothetical protein